jgi:hypothetical protein
VELTCRSITLVALTGAVVALVGCGTSVPGSAQPAPAPATIAAAPTTSAAESANRSMCIDLDARGGQLYTAFVVPMMAGSSGRKSVEVDIATITHAVTQVAHVGADGALKQTTGDVADEGERMVAAAEAFQAVDHFEGTALLTSFVGLAVACQEAGHKPSWFNATELMTS